MSEDRQDVRHDFPEALRLVQSGCQVRRAAWPPAWLYISQPRPIHVATMDLVELVELVREEVDGKGRYCFAVPWLGGAAIGTPTAEDVLAVDWTVVEDPRVPTEKGGERAQAARLAEIDVEGEEAGQAPGAVGCGAER
jgi:hypothetical protein